MDFRNRRTSDLQDTGVRSARPLVDRERIIGTQAGKKRTPNILRRIVICVGVVLFVVSGFYLSLIVTAEPLQAEEYAQVIRAIELIENGGFASEAFYLRRIAIFRGGDNWLNASVAKENAYAATNFPFGIVTLYPDYFSYTADDNERAAILLHEARHLIGEDEKRAYRFVWENKKNLGWTKDRYRESVVWKEIRNQTKEYSPSLFVCEFNEFSDCTE